MDERAVRRAGREALRKEFGELYATVSIVTGVAYYFGLQYGFPQDFVIIAAAAIGFTLRVLAIAEALWLESQLLQALANIARRVAARHQSAARVRGAFAVRMGRQHDPHGVVRDVAGDWDLAAERLHRLEAAPIGDATLPSVLA